MTFDPENPPYVPGGVSLDTKTVSMSAVQNWSIMYNVCCAYSLNLENLQKQSDEISAANAYN